MESNLPFRTDGVYVTKINPEEEFPDHKPTKLGSMWKIAQGKREFDYYRILYFKEKFISLNNTYPKIYEADFKTMEGELIMIVDSCKLSIYKSFENIEISNSGFSMSNEKLSISGNFTTPLVQVSINIKSSDETENFKMRFIPWI